MGPVVEPGLTIIGELAEHHVARPFAAVIQRVHHRYATEIVGAFRMCPFMKDPETAFGKFVVVLSRELEVELAADVVIGAGVQVVHLIYPLTDAGPAEFERFGNALHQNVKRRANDGPVHAAFHPRMEGDATSAARLIGFVRRAPDPFVQFVPEGLHQGGSTFVDLANIDLATFVKAQQGQPANNSQSLFDRLDNEHIRVIQNTIAAIHAERNRDYREFLDALGVG